MQGHTLGNMATLFFHVKKNPYLVGAILLIALAVGGVMAMTPAVSTVTPAGQMTTITATKAQPNIIFIRTDDQDARSMSTLTPSGQPVMKNVLDHFGTNGVAFDQSYVSFSLCCPSRATTLTGQYAHSHGVLSNNFPTGGYELFNQIDDQTLAVWLKDAGYFTAHVGKYFNGYDATTTPPYAEIPPGWDKWFTVIQATSPDYYNYNVLEDGPTLQFFGTGASNYQTDVFTDKVVSYLDTRPYGNKPFFIQLDYTAPHKGGSVGKVIPAPRHTGLMNGATSPQGPAFDEADVSDKPADIQALPPLNVSQINTINDGYRRRSEALMSVDEGVARIIQKLKDTGQYQNTVIIYSSDNGWMFGEHRLPQSKFVPYEESVRVPLYMSGPGIPKGKVMSQLVNDVDLTATMLHFARAPSTIVQEGRSLVTIMRNPQASWRNDFLIENPLLNYYTGIITQDNAAGTMYKYVEYDYDMDGAWDERELYALKPDACMPNGDAYELESQHNNPCYATLLSTLEARLSVLRNCTGIACR